MVIEGSHLVAAALAADIKLAALIATEAALAKPEVAALVRRSRLEPIRVSAAVILNPARRVNGLADSKVLSAERREVLAERIKERATAWSVAFATVEEIDRLNIFHASMLAMPR